MPSRRNIAGTTIGNIQVLSVAGFNSDRKRYLYNCRCSCGKEFLRDQDTLVNAKNKMRAASCGCERMSGTRKYFETGEKIGRFTILSRFKSNEWHTRSLAQCECGKIKIVINHELRNGQVQSCGCLQKERMMKANRKAVGHSGIVAVYGTYKKAAKDRGYEFKISKEYFTETTKKDCFYCGDSPSMKRNDSAKDGGFVLHNGIDRVDNNIGYIEGNCVPCCKVCNRAKGTLTSDEFKEWTKRLYNRLFQRS
jgi:hypothetical protein